MVKSDSNTGVGAGGGAGGKGGQLAKRGPAGRRVANTGKRSAPSGAPSGGGGGDANRWRFYQEDSPGLQVNPVSVMFASLLFIACVFMLHIWGKFSRG